MLLNPYLISTVVDYLTSQNDVTSLTAYTSGFGIVLVSAIFAIAMAQAFHANYIFGMNVRTALGGFIYQQVR